MLFTTPTFVVFCVIAFALYYLPILRRFQVLLLVIASMIFYAWTEPWLLILLVISILSNSVISYRVALNDNPDAQLRWAISGIVLNLALLALFKYAGLLSGFFLGVFNAPDPVDGIAYLLLHLPLPIGISFYTFEGISLVADILRNRKRARAEPGWKQPRVVDQSLVQHTLKTAFFISFFPHLIAGPVLKANTFFPQIGERRLRDINWEAAFQALIIGYFLKMVVADNLQDLTFWMTYPYYQTRSTLNNLVLLYGYSIQIFADFAGYSLIAIGLGRLFGYELMRNFNFPYISQSLSEFWRRWHISLSTWLRDYLYIPLGGNRKGEGRTYLNLLIVMGLGGLWHGAAWSYALWGLFHGLGLAIERFFTLSDPAEQAIDTPLWLRFLRDALRVGVVFCFVSIGWVFFKLPDINHALDFFATLIRNAGNRPSLSGIVAVLLLSLPVVLYHLPHFPTMRYLLTHVMPQQAQLARRSLQHAAFGLMLALLLLNPGSSEAFIYFQF